MTEPKKPFYRDKKWKIGRSYGWWHIPYCPRGLHGDKPSGGYEWTLKDGRVVKLLVAIENGGDKDADD